ncbi:MAG: TetR/AcrR family transcriptional regulator [Acidimicrobiales bacterium]|nr:TetR/AcrR family transcriptional regulator [Acidimicrobiales bacterium]
MSAPGGEAQRTPLRRELIVDTAREMVEQEGLDALSLRRLASALGVTAPALYAHFASKDDLLAAVAAAEFGGLVEAIQAATASLEDPVERIVAQSHAYVDHARAHPALIQLMTVFRPGWIPQPAAPELAAASRTFEVSSVAVQDAIDAGLLRDDDPLMVGLTLWAAAHGVATVLASRPNLGEDYEAALVDSVVQSVVRGLLA